MNIIIGFAGAGGALVQAAGRGDGGGGTLLGKDVSINDPSHTLELGGTRTDPVSATLSSPGAKEGSTDDPSPAAPVGFNPLSVPGSAGEPDVLLVEVFRRPIVPGRNYRGVSDADRIWVRYIWQKYGPSTSEAIQAGHKPGRSHVFTLPGETTYIMPQRASVNLGQAADEARAAAARRAYNADPNNVNKLPVR